MEIENENNKKNEDIIDNCPEFIKPLKRACPTCYIFISNVNIYEENIEKELENIFLPFGEFNNLFGPIFISKKKHLCYICYKDNQSAQKVIEYSEVNDIYVGNRKVVVRYADLNRVKIPPPEPECTSETNNVTIPGLYLIPEFVTIEEEKELLDFADGNDENGRQYWKSGLTRRVQHFGYEFNYSTLLLDKTSNIRSIPSNVLSLLETKLPQSEASFMTEELTKINQLTINEYYPGQGISSHVDTESCFGSFIFVISLGSDIVMTLTELNNVTEEGEGEEKNQNDILEDDDNKSDSNKNNNNAKNNENNGRRNFGPTKSSPGTEQVKKHLLVPARSLLILSGPARYTWAHGIANRKMDKVDGVLKKRSRRISYTLREGLLSNELQNSINQINDSKNSTIKSNSSNTTNNTENPNNLLSQSNDSKGIQSTNIEEKHVFEVYDEIALHWHHTRGKRKVYWARVKIFLESLPFGSLVADIGCGDGKYFGVNPNIESIGCDRSPVLLKVSADPANETFCCDAVKLPLISNAFDGAICIAVLHHLASEDRRLAVIAEMIRIMKPGAQAMLQAWALEQEKGSRRKFREQNVLVPWQLQNHFTLKNESTESNEQESENPQNTVYQRFCHVYCEGELENLANRVPGCRVLESGYDKSNWYICFEKYIV